MSQDHIVGLQCSKCKNVNYITTRNRKQVAEKLKPSKFCKTCRAKSDHKEVKV